MWPQGYSQQKLLEPAGHGGLLRPEQLEKYRLSNTGRFCDGLVGAGLRYFRILPPAGPRCALAGTNARKIGFQEARKVSSVCANSRKGTAKKLNLNILCGAQRMGQRAAPPLVYTER